jgi:hypothetical protein
VTNELEKLNSDLAEARERMRLRDRLNARLHHVRRDLRAERARLQPLREILARENADVRRLEGLGLTALFHAVLGSKERQLDKERQEALAAKLKHDEAAFAVTALVEEERRCAQEVDAVFDAEVLHRSALESKEALLRRENPGAAERLIEFANRIGGDRADLKEIEEARAAGLRARSTLRVVIDRLGRAETWGSWDMLGGGLVATAAKQSNLDEAKSHAFVAQRQLAAFHRELQDIGERLRTTFEIGSFLRFADWFLDGLIIDWMVQDRIRTSLAGATKALSQVEAVMIDVEARLGEARQRLARAEQDRREFLERA